MVRPQDPLGRVELAGGDPGQRAARCRPGHLHAVARGLQHPHGRRRHVRGEVVGERVHPERHRGPVGPRRLPAAHSRPGRSAVRTPATSAAGRRRRPASRGDRRARERHHGVDRARRPRGQVAPSAAAARARSAAAAAAAGGRSGAAPPPCRRPCPRPWGSRGSIPCRTGTGPAPRAPRASASRAPGRRAPASPAAPAPGLGWSPSPPAWPGRTGTSPRRCREVGAALAHPGAAVHRRGEVAPVVR